jgi:hypothetical protein
VMRIVVAICSQPFKVGVIAVRWMEYTPGHTYCQALISTPPQNNLILPSLVYIVCIAHITTHYIDMRLRAVQYDT